MGRLLGAMAIFIAYPLLALAVGAVHRGQAAGELHDALPFEVTPSDTVIGASRE